MFPSPEGLETSLAGEPVRQVPRLRPRISTPPHVILTGTPVPAGQWSSPIFTDGETEAQRPYIFCKAREGTWRARSKCRCVCTKQGYIPLATCGAEARWESGGGAATFPGKRQPRPGPTSVLRCPAAGHQRAAPSVAKYWQPVPVRGRRPRPAPLNQQTHNWEILASAAFPVWPHWAKNCTPQMPDNPGCRAGMDGARQAQRAAALTHTHTHTQSHICGGEGLQNQPSRFGIPALTGLQAKAPQVALTAWEKGSHLPWREDFEIQTRPARAVQRRAVHPGGTCRGPFSGQKPF